jgi:hypothetical protein
MPLGLGEVVEGKDILLGFVYPPSGLGEALGLRGRQVVPA